MQFKATSGVENFVEIEKKWLEHWSKSGLTKKYLQKNQKSTKKFSFLDGPITANNPMGVHHAWGRTYKDLFQRFFNMRGYSQRFQNGFDEQGLWVEVEVERELGLKSKKDIENLVPGNKFASLEKFVNLCKERVKKYSAIQTEQSKRLGYFMDWDNSYHTSSDENNYAIWNFLKVIHKNGWLYKGRDSVPWCPRCGTAISQHEILTEEYKQITHTSVYLKFPVKDNNKEWRNTSILSWTTTPWTLPANVALAVDPNMDYVCVPDPDIKGHWLVLGYERFKNLLQKNYFPASFNNLSKKEVDIFKGKEMIGIKYEAPFDSMEAVRKSLLGYQHSVIATDTLILPISTDEGTSVVHLAPGAGAEDFALGKKEKLPVVGPIDETATYVNGFDFLAGLTVTEANQKIVEYLAKNGFLFKVEDYTHRYPTCWRCKTELVWRVVDEWYIAMDRPSPAEPDSAGVPSKTYREQMIEVAKKINWLPKWGLDRELDWLKNMHDWLISKKRYWGLALPIWECSKCGNFEVIGSIEELKERAIQGWDKFENHSPHRPWVDEIKIKCSKCEELVSRISDVGSPWLDAGIVPFSTMPSEWFPADFITESFPGQFKNWFYSLIAMSTALKNTNPFKTILGHASVRDEKGEEMHKSKGNAIEFNEAADRIGVDVMRWLYMRTNPEHNVNFGYRVADEIRRFFHLRLWNVYSFFVMYAIVDGWVPSNAEFKPANVLDRWILSRMNGNTQNITRSLEKYDACDAVGNAEIFIVRDLSNWYVRRIRDRVGPTVPDGKDKEDAYQTLWLVLTKYSQVLAPFIPYLTEEIYTNLTGEPSVHLKNWPEAGRVEAELEKIMEEAINLSSAVHAFRKANNLKVRTPLLELSYKGPRSLDKQVEQIVLEEVNVGKLVFRGKENNFVVSGDTGEKNQDQVAGEARDLVRIVQEKRKEASLALNDRIVTYLKSWPKEYENYIKQQTLSRQLIKSQEIRIEKVNR